MKRLIFLLAFAASPAFAQTDYVRDWLILGSFPHADATTRLFFDFLGGEATVKPRGGETIAGRAWLLYHSPREFIDFRWSDLPFSARERCAVYAALFVQSPREQKVRLMVGSDDGITIWCNGQTVHQNDVYRGVVLDNDTVLVALKSGWNTILMKVVNGDGGYGLSARFADGEGLVLSAENPFTPDRPLTPASLSCPSPKLNFNFELNVSQQLIFSYDLPLFNSGSTAAERITVELSVGDKTIASAILPRVMGGELIRFQQRLSFRDAVQVSDRKGLSRVRLRYDGKETSRAFEFTGEILRRFFEAWQLQGWQEDRMGESSVRYTRTVIVPDDLEGLGLQIAVDIWDRWGDVSVNGTKKLARFSGDSGELLLTEKAAARDTFRIELTATSEKPIQGSALVSSTIRPRHGVIERYLKDVRFAKEIYNIDLGDQTAAATQLLGLLNARKPDRAAEILRPLNQKIASFAPEAKKLALHLIGNAHIDMAWLWRYPETIEVTRATFQAALDNLKRYPNFHFSHGQAHSYFWIEQRYPEMFREIQRYVREGRWEIVGGTWVESDANIPSGESLARQYLYGKRYFKEKFGVDVKHGFFPDTFGHPATLPQILSKSGIETYTFFRPGEEERMFWWETPDGSRVFAHHPPNWYGTWSGIPDTLWTTALKTQRRFSVNNAVQFFGVGDHGGGPTRRQIEQIEQLSKVTLYPDTKMSTFASLYSSLLKEKKDAPIERGEQNPVFEGCYSSQAITKLNNRRAEALLPTAETFATLAMRYGFVYPTGDLEEAWQRVLFNQFHDILCGSSIHDVYLDADQFYLEAFERAERVLAAALRTLTMTIATNHRLKSGSPLVIFNPLNWTRSEPMEITWKSEARVMPQVVDERGRKLPVQLVSRSADSVRFVFVPKDIPSVGYRTYWIAAGYEPPTRPSADLALENRFFRVEIDKSSGCVSRIYDKLRKREVLQLGSLANQLQIQEDSAPMSAWVMGLRGEPIAITAPRSVKVMESGPVRRVVRSEYDVENSSFALDVILYTDLPRIDFRFGAEWHHRQRILKIAFPVNIVDGRATYEIPFGAIQRTTDGHEVVGQKWIDLSSQEYGVSLLNDSKYGFDVKDNVIRMTALRSPTDPDPKADAGRHEFSYALYPHAGNWEDGQTVLRGCEFNAPFVFRVADQHHGELPSTASFLEVNKPTVVVSAIKKCEDDNSLVVRLYQAVEMPVHVQLKCYRPIVNPVETDLVEWEARPIAPGDRREGAVTIRLKPFELKTLKFSLGKEY